MCKYLEKYSTYTQGKKYFFWGGNWGYSNEQIENVYVYY